MIALNVMLLAGMAYTRWGVNHRPLVLVQVAAGSEDLPFMQDRQVLAEFAGQGLDVEATPEGSSNLANRKSPKGYDAFFPSSQIFADETVARLGPNSLAEYPVFSTPLMVYTWRRLIPLLLRTGIVTASGGQYEFSVPRYLKVAGSGLRWSQIPGNHVYANQNQVVLETTDPQLSDSGALFVAAESYVLNGGRVVSSNAQVSKTAPVIAAIIAKEGEMETTTNFLYQDFRRDGMNGMPLALGYQSEQANEPSPPGAIGLQLDFPINAVHEVIPFDSRGLTFARLLTDDPALVNLEQKYGFQTGKGSVATASAFAINPPSVPYLKELVSDVDPAPPPQG